VVVVVVVVESFIKFGLLLIRTFELYVNGLGYVLTAGLPAYDELAILINYKLFFLFIIKSKM